MLQYYIADVRSIGLSLSGRHLDITSILSVEDVRGCPRNSWMFKIGTDKSLSEKYFKMLDVA